MTLTVLIRYMGNQNMSAKKSSTGKLETIIIKRSSVLPIWYMRPDLVLIFLLFNTEYYGWDSIYAHLEFMRERDTFISTIKKNKKNPYFFYCCSWDPYHSSEKPFEVYGIEYNCFDSHWPHKMEINQKKMACATL